MTTFSRVSTAITIALSGLLAVGCTEARDSGDAVAPTETSTSTLAPPPPETPKVSPILSASEAQAMVENYALENRSATQEAGESYSAETFRRVDTGPIMLANEFTVLAYERVGLELKPGSDWTEQVGQVWSAPMSEDYPQYVLTGSTLVRSTDSASSTAAPEATASAPAETPASAETAPDAVERLTAWVQEEPDGPWRKWAQAPVNLVDLPAPDTVPLSGATRDGHRDASEQLLAYLRGHDDHSVQPDEQLEEFRNFAYADPEISFSRFIAPVRNRLDPVHPDGSILAASTQNGSVGLLAVRVVHRSWVESGSYIELDDDDLRIALGLPEKPREIEQKQLMTIGYHLTEDGTVHVLGSDVLRIF